MLSATPVLKPNTDNTLIPYLLELKDDGLGLGANVLRSRARFHEL